MAVKSPEAEHPVKAVKSPEEEHPVKAYGWAIKDRTSGILSPFKFSRRATGDEDVRIKILCCGVCHTDLTSTKNEYEFLSYPLVPGLETVGIATEVGSKVTKVKVGEKVAVAAYLGTCGKCHNCLNDQENYCPEVIISYGTPYHDGTINYGGFSNETVVNERFVLHFPEKLSLSGGAPLLSAGSTAYSAIRNQGLDKPGIHLGVVGLGGLGHLAVKFAKAFGVKVTVISSTPSKKDEAIKSLGADAFLFSRDDEQMKAAIGTFDAIIDTIAVAHPLAPLLDLLRSHGKIILVGAPTTPLEVPVIPLVAGGKSITGCVVGNLKQTQEMLEFAAEHNITANVEVISMDYINTAMERLEKGDVRYRFVIDIGNTLTPPE
uniref:Dihydroprecondylocarpine acetate synthase 1 n=1 Tax=Tabernanthe iboga TaxID=141617 RepID=DPAS1_TABIB|nr:dihydroprecondylocarpine acetate synthase 1 [Tabernanthe iboga]